MEKQIQQGIGFVPAIFNVCPLPRINVGKRWERSAHGIHSVYVSEYGVPYSSNNRLWMEQTTTTARRNRSPYVDLGSVCSSLISVGEQVTSRNIKNAKDSILKYAHLHILTEREIGIVIKGNSMKQYQAVNTNVCEKVQITWASGRINPEMVRELDGLSFLVFTEKYYSGSILTAIPHVQEQYRAMRSLLKDIYSWMCQTMFSMNIDDRKDKMIKWTILNGQFFSNWNLEGQQLKNAKREIQLALAELQSKYWPALRYSVEFEGVRLYKSQMQIEPDDKRAGYFPVSIVVDDEKPLEVHWTPNGIEYN